MRLHCRYMARRRKKQDDRTKTARLVRFFGGPCDDTTMWLALPLPPRLKLDMGRAPYFQIEAGKAEYEYDSEREYLPLNRWSPPTTSGQSGDVG